MSWMPTAVPICSIIAAVAPATPRSLSSTAVVMVALSGGTRPPRPAPARATKAKMTMPGVSTPTRASSRVDRVTSTAPTTAVRRSPTRTAARPEMGPAMA